MYSIEMIKEFFGWCSIINISLLTTTVLFLIFFRQFALTIHSNLFNIDETVLNKAYFKYIAQYKNFNYCF